MIAILALFIVLDVAMLITAVWATVELTDSEGFVLGLFEALPAWGITYLLTLGIANFTAFI